MKLKKCVAAICAALMAVTGLGGCGNQSSKTITEIEFANYQGCSGDVWIKQAAARFEALKATESYETGKTGVRINVSNVKQIPYTSLNSEGYDIYIGENKANIYEMASSGFLLDLGEVVSGIEDRINPDAIKRIKGADGNYYGLPHYEWYTGVSYDQDFFKEANLYLAAPDALSRTVRSKFGEIKFVRSANERKSCGPDGEYGTSDDGLPSSLQEFIMLLSAIKDEGGRSPIIMSGACIDYAFFLVDGIWAALAGKDQIKTIYSLDSGGQKIVEVVTGYTDEDLFYSGSGLKKPTTEMIAIDESNGYKIYDMASRYYALCALELIYKEGWFEESFFKSSTKTNVQAQYSFINEAKAGILYDASFWCSEAVRNGNFETYFRQHPGEEERNVSFMPLPTTLEGSVEEGRGKKQALLDVGASQLFVSKRVENNEGKKKAVMDFLKFLYSDAELAAFTETTGLKIPISYEYDGTKLNDYFSKLTKYVEESEVVYFASDSTIVNKNLEAFALTWSGPINRPRYGNDEIAKGFLEAMKNYGYTARDIFDNTKKSESGWGNLQK